MKENNEEEEGINQTPDPILEEISANLLRHMYSDNEENIASQLTANSRVGSVPPAALQGQYQSSQGESSRKGQLTNNVVTQRPVQASRILSHQQVYGQVGYRPPLQVNSATEQQEGQEEEDVIEEENELPVASFQEIGANLPRPGRFPSHYSSPPSDYEENISSHPAAAYILFGSIPCLVQPAQYHSSRGGSSREGDRVNVTVTKDFITSVPPAEPRLSLPRQRSTVFDSYSQTPNISGYYDGLQAPPLRQQGSGLLPVVAAAEEQALMSQWQRADQTAFLGHYMPLALIQSGYTLSDSLNLSHQQLYGRFGYRPPLQIDSAQTPPHPFSQPSPAPPGNIFTHTDKPPERLEIYNQMGTMNFAQIPSHFQQPSTAPPVNIFSYTDVPPEHLERSNQMGSTNFAHIPSLPQPSPAPSGNNFTYMDIPPERYNQMGSTNFAEIPPPFPQPSPAPPANFFTYTDIPPERYNQMGLMNFAQRPHPLPPFSQHHPVQLDYSTCMGMPSLLADYHRRFAPIPPPLLHFRQPHPASPGDNTYAGMPPLLGDYDADGGETDGHSSTNVRRAGRSER